MAVSRSQGRTRRKARGSLGDVVTSISLHGERLGAGHGGTEDPVPISAWPWAVWLGPGPMAPGP